MPGSAFLETLGVFLVAAALVASVARVAHVPSIVSYLVAGLLVGPVTGLVHAGAREGGVATSAELGIVLLLFVVGLELSLARIRQVGKVAVAAGLGQVVFTALGGLAICFALGFTFMEAVFIATALTFSSTVVVVKLLDQRGDLHALYGRIAVGIFLVQDLVVVVVLTFLTGLGRPEALEPLAVAQSLGLAFGGMAILCGVALLAARVLLPRPFAWAARAPRTLYIWSLTWCLGFVVAAHAMGLSAEIGAFLAGLSLAQLGCAPDLRRRLHPLMSFFIIVFFVSLGAGMRFDAASAYWKEALALSLFVLIGNPVIFMAIVARYGYPEKVCFQTSVAVAQISEFSFIFAALGVSMGHIGEPILALVALVGVVTIAVSAYMILWSDRLYALVAPTGALRIFRARQGSFEEPPTNRPSGHVIVVGMNDLGRRLVRALDARGEAVLALDTDARKLEGLPGAKLVGDIEYAATLEEAGLAEARLAVSALRIEATNKLFAFRCKRHRVPVAVYAFDRAALEGIRTADPDHLIDAKPDEAERILRALEAAGALDAPSAPNAPSANGAAQR